MKLISKESKYKTKFVHLHKTGEGASYSLHNTPQSTHMIPSIAEWQMEYLIEYLKEDAATLGLELEDE